MTDISEFKDTQLGTELQVDDVLEAFELLDDWEERYAYIIDLGRKLPAFPEPEKTEINYVHGCQSQVWLIHQKDPETDKLYFLIDSDAMIVKGLAAIVLIALNARTPDELMKTDIDELFQQIDLFRHISPTRGNGLRAMVGKMKGIAEAA